jgi:hypothetical protein
MRAAAQLAIGIVAAFASALLAVECLGWVNVWTIGWTKSWRDHLPLFFLLRDAVAFLPAIFGLAFVMRFIARPPRPLFALCCVVAAFAIDLANVALESPRLILPTVRMGAGLYLAFLVGVPLVVLGLDRLRSN